MFSFYFFLFICIFFLNFGFKGTFEGVYVIVGNTLVLAILFSSIAMFLPS